ncbi:hypothetical protein C9446_06035 [Providencia heimbachae]|uniref:YcxB family protein n=1 Tax=Providencia heimbachae TaxID=333962 RepID=UPI0010BF2148|nr:YcxB family protein [Providencia heimbachae]QCJ69459.1 hypothetical protein C9446_06035 [Providencia heimbachae]
MMEPFKVTLDRKEFIRFNNYCYKNNYFYNSKTWNPSVAIMFAVFVIAFVMAFQFFNITLAHLSIAFIISLFLFLFVAARILQTFSRAIPDVDSYLLSEKEYRIDEQGLHETTKFGYAFFKWDAFKLIKTEGDLMYLFIDRVSAIIIPARSFNSAQDRQQFIQTVKREAINLVE